MYPTVRTCTCMTLYGTVCNMHGTMGPFWLCCFTTHVCTPSFGCARRYRMIPGMLPTSGCTYGCLLHGCVLEGGLVHWVYPHEDGVPDSRYSLSTTIPLYAFTWDTLYFGISLFGCLGWCTGLHSPLPAIRDACTCTLLPGRPSVRASSR